MWTTDSRLKLSNSKRRNLSERFWSKVDQRDPYECWPWTGCVQRIGYGSLAIGSRVDGSKRTTLAHRMAWELTYGAIPPEKPKVLHRCDNRRCCNPAHLFLGTQSDNVRDMFQKGRNVSANAAKTHCVRGHPFTAANTYRYFREGRLKRYCLICHTIRQKSR